MLVERETIVVEEYHRRVYDAGDLVHRALNESDSGHREMRLIPCIAWWMPRERYRVVDEPPTCIRCIAARVR